MANPYRLDVGAADSIEVNPWGDFQLIRPFVLTRLAEGEPDRGRIDGFIVQHIKRTAIVQVHSDPPRTLTSSEDISGFTSRKVENAVGEYYEMFIVEDGDILDQDQFQGGAVLHYVGDVADDKPPTSGVIEITGTSVFVRSNPDKIAEAKAAMERSERAGATRNALRFNALGQTWSTFDGTPANGLPYYVEKEVSGILGLAKSNKLVRTCKVKWTRDGKTTLTERTNLRPKKFDINESSADPVVEEEAPAARPAKKAKHPAGMSGGSTRVRTASTSRRKRGTGTARRHSSRRARAPRYRTARRG